MKISRDHKEIFDQLKEDGYYWNKEVDPVQTWNVLQPDGTRPGEDAAHRDVEYRLSEITPVIGVWWQSEWKADDPAYQDYVLIFRNKDGLFAKKYTCAGYSSVTFEPENDYDFIPNGTLADLCTFALDNKQREWVEAVIGQLILEE